MMSDVVRTILSRALLSSPLASKSLATAAHYPSYKIERVRSCYNRIIKSDALARRENKSHPVSPLVPLIASRLSRLDYKELIGQLVLDKWFSEVRDADSFNAFCGCDMSRVPSTADNPIYKVAAQRGRNYRAEALVFRISEELQDSGFPVFWTLTVSPEYDDILDKRREEFKVWLRKVRKAFGSFRYCAVTERGDQTGRLHMHCLFLFDSAARFTDPNFAGGRNRLVPELRGFWPYGFGDPVAVRFSPSDAWGSIGWRWPFDAAATGVEAVARYMGKYVTSSTVEVSGCRSKMSRNFGLTQISQMTLAQAMLLLSGNQTLNLSRPFLMKPPFALLKSVAIRKLFGHRSPLSLPATKTGSVSLAAQTLKTLQSSRMNVGDSIVQGLDFEWKTNPHRRLLKPVPIGHI